MTEKRSCWPKFLRGIFDRYNSYMNKGGSDPPPPNFAVRTNLRTQKSRLRHCYATATPLLATARHCYATATPLAYSVAVPIGSAGEKYLKFTIF